MGCRHAWYLLHVWLHAACSSGTTGACQAPPLLYCVLHPALRPWVIFSSASRTVRRDSIQPYRCPSHESHATREASEMHMSQGFRSLGKQALFRSNLFNPWPKT